MCVFLGDKCIICAHRLTLSTGKYTICAHRLTLLIINLEVNVQYVHTG